MMPVMHVALERIAHNASHISRLLKDRGLVALAVTKGCADHPAVVETSAKAGIHRFGFSAPKPGLNAPGETVLIGPLAPSKVEAAACLGVQTGISSMETAQALAMAAAKRGRPVPMRLCLELGDLREGVPLEGCVEFAKVADSPWTPVVGVQTNFGCLSGALPTPERLDAFVAAAEAIEGALGRRLEHVSVGGSMLLANLDQGPLPAGVTELRIGEALLLGQIPNAPDLDLGLSREVMRFGGEVIELFSKNTTRIGGYGPDAKNGQACACRGGRRLRALLDFGGLDVDPEGLIPLDVSAFFVGATSDYAVYDVDACERRPSPGDWMWFTPQYDAMARAFRNSELEIRFVEHDAESPGHG